MADSRLRTRLAALVSLVCLVVASPQPSSAAEKPLDSAVDAYPGIARAHFVSPYVRNELRVALGGTLFNQTGFVPGTGGSLTGAHTWGAVGYTLTDKLAIAANYEFASHRGNLDPTEIQAYGDLTISTSYIAFIAPAEAPVLKGIAVHGGIEMLGGGYVESLSPFFDLQASGEVAGVRLATSAGFLLDRSAGVVGDGVILDPAQRVAYGVADDSSFHWIIGADYPLWEDRISPYFQYRGRAYLGEAAGDPPQLLGVGARMAIPFEGRTFGLTLGGDVAVGGTRTTAKRPKEPTVRVLAQLTFVAPPARIIEREVRIGRPAPTPKPTPVATPAPTPPPPQFGAVKGVVRDGESGEPLANTIITFLGFRRNALLTDDYGRWRQGEFKGGEIRVRAKKQGYSPAVTTVAVEAGRVAEADIDLLPAKSSSKKIGTLSGVVRSRAGKPLQSTVVVQVGKSSKEINTDKTGRFRADLPPGTYVVRVEARGHSAQTRSLKVTGGELTIYNFLLSGR